MTDKIECGMYAVDYIREDLKEGLVYVLDGSVIHNLQDFFGVSSHVFDFPLKDETKWDQYLDWIRDFTWLPPDTRGVQISIFISSYLEIFAESYSDKQDMVDINFEDIFPFWQNEVVDVYVGGKRRSFKVYIMSGDGTKEGQGPTLHPVEYRIALGKNSEFKKAWFTYGDGTFPKEAEEAIYTMGPGESKLITVPFRGVNIDEMIVDLPIDNRSLKQLEGKRDILMVTPEGTALASILSTENDRISLDLSEGLRSIPLELRTPKEETGWTYSPDEEG